MTECGLKKYLKDVDHLDKMYGLEHLRELNTQNLGFMGLAVAGEVGELANVIKKIWRGSVDEDKMKELFNALDEEAVDVLIYLCEIVLTAVPDFDKVWEEKHIVLHERFQKRLMQYRLDNRVLEREGVTNVADRYGT